MIKELKRYLERCILPEIRTLSKPEDFFSKVLITSNLEFRMFFLSMNLSKVNVSFLTYIMKKALPVTNEIFKII